MSLAKSSAVYSHRVLNLLAWFKCLIRCVCVRVCVGVCMYVCVYAYVCTVNGERFAGLNFYGFRGFELTAKVFP